ncbi:MAG: patatin-like phospholipase family protein, partial [Spirochaetaceae bacterium]|nr:patatin-like phospholipase family protein [Spirochaetaceae bacterium]
MITQTLSSQVFSQETQENTTNERPSVALVMGGGGAKGFALIPVLEVIEELNIPIDMIIGNSAGAIIGGLYSIGYTPEEIRQTVIDTNWASMFADRPNSPLESLLESRSTEASPITLKLGKNFSIEMGGGFSMGQNAYLLLKELAVKIPSYIDFDSLPIPFRATAVDLVTGELELIESGDIAEAIRSSMSIPGVFQPFPIDDKLYVDGFVRNNLPIQQAKDMGYDVIIAVSLDDPLIDDPKRFDANPLDTITQVVRIVTSSGNPEQLELADVVIHPPVDEYNMMEFPKAKEIYEKAEKEKRKY